MAIARSASAEVGGGVSDVMVMFHVVVVVVGDGRRSMLMTDRRILFFLTESVWPSSADQSQRTS